MTGGSGVSLDRLSPGQLLALYCDVLVRLRAIGAVRNENSPTGDIAEQVVAEHFSGKVATNNRKSYDVLAAETGIVVDDQHGCGHAPSARRVGRAARRLRARSDFDAWR